MKIIELIYLVCIGLIFGSLINALVWRLSKQLDADGNPIKTTNAKRPTSNVYSITRGRSMCPNCKHTLAAKDLVPVFSWLSLKGRCRYCKKPISKQYPLIELATALLFGISYIFWPNALNGVEWFVFAGYIGTLVCLIALAVYDYKTSILPSRLIYIGIAIYSVGLLLYSVAESNFYRFGIAYFTATLYFIIFAAIFMLSYLAYKQGWSSKEWLGFGDVRLALLLGLILGEPFLVFIAMFSASIIGIIFTLPSLVSKKSNLTTQVPFGPYLICGAILTIWWGNSLLDWYTVSILGL